jgi:hypothetical protein
MHVQAHRHMGLQPSVLAEGPRGKTQWRVPKVQGITVSATSPGVKSISIRIMTACHRPLAALQFLFLMRSLSGSH